MTPLRNRCRICLIAGFFGCLKFPTPVLAAAAGLPDDRAYPASFTDDATRPYDRFGLFIGIDKYPNIVPNRDLDGCVNDAHRLADLFTGPLFGIQRYAVLTNDAATREGIAAALHHLVGQVKVARSKTDKPITVVISYSGHGSRLRRKSPDPALPPLDSTWVAEDSDVTGARDMRGEEILLAHRALADLGAQVIMISDSCHAGTAYRSADPFAKARQIPREGRLGEGPTDHLFDDLQQPDSAPPLTEGALPGFVWYAACPDAEVSREVHDSVTGKTFGRLTLTISRLLSTEPATTYVGLARRIEECFAAQYPDQQPEFHAGYGKAEELFFQGRSVIPHGDILKINSANDSVDVSMGLLEGIAEGTSFAFYADSSDAQRHVNALASGRAAKIDLGHATVSLPKGTRIPKSAWAIPGVVRYPDFALACDAGVPTFIQKELRLLSDNGQVILAGPGAPRSAVLLYAADRRSLALYPASALPEIANAIGSPSGQPPPAPLAPPIILTGDETSDAPRVAEIVLFAARMRRLLLLDHQPDHSPLVRAVAAGQPPLAAEIMVGGVVVSAAPAVELTRGSDAVLRVTNNTIRPFFLNVFEITPASDVLIRYPRAGEDTCVVTSAAPRDLAITPTLDTGTVERTHLKIIATSKFIDFSPLMVKPVAGEGNVKDLQLRTRGGDDPLFSLLRDTLHGGSVTRDIIRMPVEETTDWGTLSMSFDVVAPK